MVSLKYIEKYLLFKNYRHSQFLSAFFPDFETDNAIFLNFCDESSKSRYEIQIMNGGSTKKLYFPCKI